MARLLSRLISGRSVAAAATPSAPGDGTAPALTATPLQAGNPLGADQQTAGALSALMDGVAEALFVLDEHLRFAAASAPLLALLGVPETALLGCELKSVLIGAELGNGGRPTAVIFRRGDGTTCAGQLTFTLVSVGTRAFRVGILASDGQQAVAPTLASPAAAAASAANAQEALAGLVQARSRGATAPLSIIAGRIELISLEVVKKALGPRWAALAGRAKLLASSIISRRLAPGDVFVEANGDSFLICFATLTQDEAKLKAKLIAREIRERMLGEEPVPFEITAQVTEVRIDPRAAAQCSDLVAMLSNELDAARADFQSRVNGTIAVFRRTATLALVPVRTKDRRPTELAIARLQNDAGEPPPVAADDDIKVHSELNMLLLGLAIKHLYVQMAQGRAAPLIVPVDFRVISESRYVDDYRALFGKLDEPARARLIFELYGFEHDTPQLRLLPVLTLLAQVSARRIVRAPDVGYSFPDLSRFRVSIVSLAAGRIHTQASGARALKKFVAMAHANGTLPQLSHSGGGCRVLIRDIPDPAAQTWFAENGADLLSPAAAG